VYNRRAEMPKRREIIRESEISRFPKRVTKQYESIIFTPLTRGYFEKRITYFALKGRSYLADQFALYEYPNFMLRSFTSLKLHDDRYPYWLVKYNAQDELVVRAGLRQPESRLGFVRYVEKSK
jgi:hypothetical protein